MKKYYLFLFLTISSTIFAQNFDTKSISESEMKSASKLFNLAVNPNTQNYDITYHKLEFSVNPSQYFISGVVTTTYTALSNMSNITFDLTSELNVSSVKRNNINLVFDQNSNDELIVTLPAVQTAGTSDTVVITYSGQPASDEQAFVTSEHNGTPVLWTLSEPFGARDWWPCKQDLNDKVDIIDVYITAPSQYVSVSNGLEQSAVINGSSKTTHFRHEYPIPAYLIAIAVTNYSIYTQEAGQTPNEFPIVNYIYPENLTTSQNQLNVTPPIMDFYESLFGTYPFANEKYGHAQCGFGGGMEHTTVSFMGGFGRNLIAHELGHQWFGDKVTCGTWQDIWLNEGFAEYLSGLVVEHLDGEDSFINWKAFKSEFITSQPGGTVYLNESEAENVGRIFSSRLSYSKGAMVLNMLRFKLGDAAFFQGLQNYLNDPDLAYGYATTPDLIAHLEAASGIELDEFFNDWVYQPGYPIYTITAQNINPGQVKITVNQSQSTSEVDFFEMPVPVRLYGASGQVLDLVLENTEDGQEFIQNIPFSVVNIEFDPKRDIISSGSEAFLGTKNNALVSNIKIAPNPVNSVLTISVPENVSLLKTQIYNMMGQLVFENSVESQLNVNKLSSGIYLLNIFTTEGNAQQKFVKK